MKKILLTQGKNAFVDDEDFQKLNQYKWCFHKLGYAVRRSKQTGNIVYMHRELLKVSQVDHKDGNKLNNQKNNLRSCNHSQNNANRFQRNNTSGIKGVYWDKARKKWHAQIQVNRKMIALGRFTNKQEAGLIYNEAAIKYFGEFAKLNSL